VFDTSMFGSSSQQQLSLLLVPSDCFVGLKRRPLRPGRVGPRLNSVAALFPLIAIALFQFPSD